jgi:dsDNA-specific endonuclease/ATPase MutS2
VSRNLPKPHKTVDLHAESFLGNLEDYELDELVAESLDYLRDQLDAAIYWGYPEIKFIHGKGKGIVKTAVYDELRIYKQSGAISHYHPSYSNEDIVVVVIGL